MKTLLFALLFVLVGRVSAFAQIGDYQRTFDIIKGADVTNPDRAITDRYSRPSRAGVSGGLLLPSSPAAVRTAVAGRRTSGNGTAATVVTSTTATKTKTRSGRKPVGRAPASENTPTAAEANQRLLQAEPSLSPRATSPLGEPTGVPSPAAVPTTSTKIHQEHAPARQQTTIQPSSRMLLPSAP